MPDDEADLALAGEAVGEKVTVEAMLSAAIDGECRQYVPEKLRISRKTMRLNIADLREMLPQSSRKRLTEQLNRQAFKAQMEAYKKKGVDDQLARLRSDGANPICACGYVFGLLTDPIISFRTSPPARPGAVEKTGFFAAEVNRRRGMSITARFQT